jgi:hypothetical protein
MSDLKQCTDHLSVATDDSRSLRRSTALADHADPLEGKPEGSRTKRSTFLEDFTVEHSLSGLQITSIQLAGSF